MVGSPNPKTLSQVAHVETRGAAAVIQGEIREILAGRERFGKELYRVLGKVRAEMQAGRDALVTLTEDGGGRGVTGPPGTPPARKKVAALSPGASKTLSEFLARTAQDLKRTTSLGGLVLCGGDIAIATCRALGAVGIVLGGEVEPGVPWGHLVGGERPDLPVITKAGGFGTPHVFRTAIRFLRRRTA